MRGAGPARRARPTRELTEQLLSTVWTPRSQALVARVRWSRRCGTLAAARG